MGVSVSIEASGPGFQEALLKIGALEDRLLHPEPGLELVADALEAHTAEVFITQGGRLKGPWARLAPKTVKARTRRWGYYRAAPAAGVGPEAPILVWTGQLRGSYKRGSSYHLREITSSELRWGTWLPYAAFHRNRPVLGFANDWQRRETLFQPFRLWLQGAEPGAIRATMGARLGLVIT
jgi:hypothetical protein